jgi:hypothetical protein
MKSIKRRTFLAHSAAVAAAALGITSCSDSHTNSEETAALTANGTVEKSQQIMKAGFARVKITPPLGTTMMGFGTRDMTHGCEGVHDDIYVRAFFLEHAGEQALIMGFDLCFLGRADADRFKGAIGRKIDISPRQILMNSSHNHVSPSVGTWYYGKYKSPERFYMNELEQATVRAVCQARQSMREVTMWAGTTRSSLPMNRRRKNENGQIENRPNPDGLVYDRLPICLFKDKAGKPVCLLFSVSTHASMIGGFEISAEYPGVAMRVLDEHLGTVGSLFLQGVAGDSKPCVIGKGVDRWRPGTWELMEKAGNIVAQEVIQLLKKGLVRVEPGLCVASVETQWPLENAPPRSEFEAIVSGTGPEKRNKKNIRYMWAVEQLGLLDKGYTLPNSVIIKAHGLQLGKGLRIFALEGEPVAEFGSLVEKFYGSGTTFPIGYTDGEALYLPTSKMLPEGGYEVVSYWEYGYPAPLAKGMEDAVLKALAQLRDRGIR